MRRLNRRSAAGAVLVILGGGAGIVLGAGSIDRPSTGGAEVDETTLIERCVDGVCVTETCVDGVCGTRTTPTGEGEGVSVVESSSSNSTIQASSSSTISKSSRSFGAVGTSIVAQASATTPPGVRIRLPLSDGAADALLGGDRLRLELAADRAATAEVVGTLVWGSGARSRSVRVARRVVTLEPDASRMVALRLAPATRTLAARPHAALVLRARTRKNDGATLTIGLRAG